jgi:peptidoglycan/LPS O-acetylase OafA/YrhL
MRTLGEAFDPRHNSLNALRLGLALTVLFSHAWGIAGFGEGAVNGTASGTMAVYGFFGISGFLITASAERNRAGRYLWQRALRILPAFWVSLVLTAFGLALVGWLVGGHSIHGYDQGSDSPVLFVWRNLLLQTVQNTIHGTVWNGSMWTLFYEALCYLGLLALARVGALRHRAALLAVAAAAWTTQILITISPKQAQTFNLTHNWIWMNIVKFAAIFLVGAVLWAYRDLIPDSGWLALGCTLLFAASLALPGTRPAFLFRLNDIGAPLVAYPLLWLGCHLPLQRVGAKNDYSYGTYLYAFPITQLLVIAGASAFGYIPFALIVLVCTAACAVGSWWAVERWALSLKHLRIRPVAVKAKVPEPIAGVPSIEVDLTGAP